MAVLLQDISIQIYMVRCLDNYTIYLIGVSINLKEINYSYKF